MEVESIGLEGLGDLILETIISKLDPKHAALIACASTRLGAAASHEILWRIFCARDFAVDSPRDPEGNPCLSFKVRASSVFVPEMSDLNGGGEGRYFYSYSIHMSLLPEGCKLDGTYYSSCHLDSRHWIIRAKEVVVSDVNGEAVIGKFPLLLPNEEEFVFESCTPLPDAPGSVEGSFTFVPGRLRKPEGRQFDVTVTPFPLEAPEYIF